MSGFEIYQKQGTTWNKVSADAIPKAEKGVAGGVATLNAAGMVPETQLPSYVDSVVETYIVGTTPLAADWLSTTVGGTPLTPTEGKIYVVLTAGEYQNKTYRWGTTTYVEIAKSLSLGITHSTAYYGDYGKVAYDHTFLTSGNPHGVTKADVGLGNCDNTSDANKPISTATQTALDNLVNTKLNRQATHSNRVIVSGGETTIGVSDITTTELGYLDGVSSNIQTQFNGKLANPTGTKTTGYVIKATDTGSEWAAEAASLCPFPVGSIFTTVGDTDPSTYWTGTTWGKLADGTFLMADSNGGKEAVDAELPNIHGTIGCLRNTQVKDGVFSSSYSTTDWEVCAGGGWPAGQYGYNIGVFNARDSNATYKDGGNVIPTGTIKVVMWERLT